MRARELKMLLYKSWLETRWGMPRNMPERVQDMTDRLATGPRSLPA